MPKFYFHLINQVSARDHEGRELADLDEATAAARADILSILGDDARRGRLDLRGRIDIADETGAIVRTVAFADAVQLHLPGDAE
ncbi:MAG TPA: hypothetical protein VF686_02185 [Brevundimonas sp.]|jgi:hypothetical protein